MRGIQRTCFSTENCFRASKTIYKTSVSTPMFPFSAQVLFSMPTVILMPNSKGVALAVYIHRYIIKDKL